MWGAPPRRGKLFSLPQELKARGGTWLKESGVHVPSALPVGLCKGWGGEGLLWVLSSPDWQVGTEGRTGCGQTRGPKTCQSEGYMDL